jgi:hypothetical protein
MPEKKMKFVHWDAVLADIEAQIAELQSAAKTIKKIRDLGVGLGRVEEMPYQLPESKLTRETTDEIRSDAFFKMTIADAAIKFLRKWANRTPQPTKAIIAALTRGGIKDKNYQTVYKILTRRAKEKNDVVNVHGDWGLPEWYLADDGTQQSPPAFTAAALRDQQG